MAISDKKSTEGSDVENGVVPPTGRGVLDTAIAQILGVAILEFGVVFHSILIGLTLAVDQEFKILFIVIIFHREPLCRLASSVANDRAAY